MRQAESASLTCGTISTHQTYMELLSLKEKEEVRKGQKNIWAFNSRKCSKYEAKLLTHSSKKAYEFQAENNKRLTEAHHYLIRLENKNKLKYFKAGWE